MGLLDHIVGRMRWLGVDLACLAIAVQIAFGAAMPGFLPGSGIDKASGHAIQGAGQGAGQGANQGAGRANSPPQAAAAGFPAGLARCHAGAGFAGAAFDRPVQGPSDRPTHHGPHQGGACAACLLCQATALAAALLPPETPTVTVPDPGQRLKRAIAVAAYPNRPDFGWAYPRGPPARA